jgi:hypothetical protein
MQDAGPKIKRMYWFSIILTSKGTSIVTLFKTDGALTGMLLDRNLLAAD